MVSVTLVVLLVALAGTNEPPDAVALFDAARSAGTPEGTMELLQRAAALGHANAQKMIGLAHAQGHGGVEQNPEEALVWFRAAAAQGDEEAAFNLVALCDAQPRCVKGTASVQDALGWLQAAGAQGMAEASFQAGR
eukprot:5361841-Prymnesium_polylepis.1